MAAAAQPGLRADRRQPRLDPRQGGSRPAAGLAIRIEIRVKPGASRTRVGGRYGADVLVVAVSAPAVDGRATRAALEAMGEALGLARREVRLVSGTTSRTKLVEVDGDHAARLQELLDR